jgi:D-alanine-D-alanine ligase-like ATP-grasp enzyme
MISALIQESGNAKNEDFAVCDYRNAASIRLVQMQIPMAIQQLAMRITRAFYMKFTAIDWRLTPNGKYVFLEANPAPMFVNAQQQLDVQMDKAILSMLLE